MENNQENMNELSMERPSLNLEPLRANVEKLRAELHKVIVGQDEMITLILAGLMTGGHVLIEGVPGIAKTLTVNLIAQTMNLSFKRIQFTPDLMPADVTGTNVFNMKSGEFEYKVGPIFANLVLIDEINRSPAKTQAALFEVMQENQMTIDGQTHKLPSPFMVLATQNPIEQEGTYKLPEAQQDRFLFKIKIDYPSLEEEVEILNRFGSDFYQKVNDSIQTVMSAQDIAECKELVQKVHIQNDLVRYIASIVDYTRHTGDLFLGASPRASLSILKTSKALAAMKGRDFVTPEDIRHAVFPVLNHRLILSPEKEMEGLEVRDIIESIINKIEVPR